MKKHGSKMSLNSLRGSATYMWDTSKTLGQGATSKVYRGRKKISGEEIAVKVFTSAGQMRPLDVQLREYTVMRKLKHRNIVELLAIEEEQGTYNKVIVMELSNVGSLYSILDEPKNAFGLEEEEFVLVVRNVDDCTNFLSLRDSLVLDIDDHEIVSRLDIGIYFINIYKLTDFGAARQLEHEDEQFMSLYGTEEYLHPDIYGKAVMRDVGIGAFDASVDLWSLGVTFFQTATGQLPFRPYGGRKNKKTMYEITRSKEPGVISGVQKTEGGEIEWSKELPQTCRLSSGLKTLVTPLLAGLLEMNEKKKWSFEQMFDKVDNITRKSVVFVFSATTWMSIRIYIDGDKKLSKFQDLIAEQFDIAACEQLLLFEDDLFTNVVDSLTPIRDYPTSISISNPVLVFMKHYFDQKKFPIPIMLDFPTFGTQINVGNDYQLAKFCCSIIYFYLWSVKRFHSKQFLVKESVHQYINQLHFLCSKTQTLLDACNKVSADQHKLYQVWYRLHESNMSLQQLGLDVKKNFSLLQSMKGIIEDTTVEKME
ncbi:hypothetical protein KUTeg_020567 [Tegillarca granosa]|uniref:Protein kinase domain-containing protein n=1 Tax=Tegillarca granosa TaxID=220873 RepID=A0ABQ9E8R6_TEGGR|nr:hypothetical protein KUTeg_020567 [Tegillarca granosa]